MNVSYEPRKTPKGDFIVMPVTHPIFIVVNAENKPIEGTDDFEFACKLAEFVGGTIARGD